MIFGGQQQVTRVVLSVATLVIVFTQARRTHADTPSESEAQALAAYKDGALGLFQEAIVALQKGDYARACPRFQAAMTLFPSPSTQINIAKCLAHEGKTASAWAAYNRVHSLHWDSAHADRREALEKMASEGAAALEPRLPKLRLIVVAPAPGLDAVLKVTQDGTVVPVGSLGVSLPVDPGAHEIAATAPGWDAWKQKVVLTEGATTNVAIELTAATPASPGPLAIVRRTPFSM